MVNFEWDEAKSNSNRHKHGISFQQAKSVFDDDYAIVYPAEKRNNENRVLIVGKVLSRFIIAVVFTMRQAVVRIISARQARNQEIKDYLSNKLGSDDGQN